MKRPRILHLSLCGLLAIGLGAGCDKGGGGKKDPRLKWVKKPTSGKTEGDILTIPGLGVTFEHPETLYVYKQCGEASHRPDTDQGNWIPVLRCQTESDGGDDYDELAEDDWEAPVVLTIYVAEKTMIINERSVETFRADYQQRGFRVESIDYYDEYLNKPNRSGIESVVHVIDPDNNMPVRELKRFMFPRGKVVFIAQIDYPYADDRSGINSDWQRILWNFQLEEDGPINPGA